jgi:hypothetical protein
MRESPSKNTLRRMGTLKPPIETTMSMKECYVFDGDGRFTGQVIDMTQKPEIRELPKIRPAISTNTVLRYNILLNAFTNTNRGW